MNTQDQFRALNEDPKLTRNAAISEINYSTLIPAGVLWGLVLFDFKQSRQNARKYTENTFNFSMFLQLQLVSSTAVH